VVNWTIAGSLTVLPALDHPELLAEPVAKAIAALPPDLAAGIGVAEIDPDLADTAAFCAEYGSPLSASANCVVVTGKREGAARHAACMVLATTRADVNGVVRRRLNVRKASFAPMADTVTTTGMAYGGITPLGLPPTWPILVDPAVAAAPQLVIGSGLRTSKLLIPGPTLTTLPTAEPLEHLAH
jgi:prolyl-tRNA editing enzyme YbaK/EbsC (Cys-tRNA(Pro) deacylase)